MGWAGVPEPASPPCTLAFFVARTALISFCWKLKSCVRVEGGFKVIENLCMGVHVGRCAGSLSPCFFWHRDTISPTSKKQHPKPTSTHLAGQSSQSKTISPCGQFQFFPL